ncbi:hypothetical protein Pcinc_011648 [Petrolisthes cinctipes]|uniref:Uncharacterized protein n=1 Tax=Petrolisthes cinctipes TaxID=88211 RepID=A0AAE1G2E1_PETCI|nr:hypothetical protein Pcinc_011648 [Petrolisthes cinctipes]
MACVKEELAWLWNMMGESGEYGPGYPGPGGPGPGVGICTGTCTNTGVPGMGGYGPCTGHNNGGTDNNNGSVGNNGGSSAGNNGYIIKQEPPPKQRRKREPHPEKWIKNVAKEKRNKGEEYVSCSGKKRPMPARAIGTPCNDGCFDKVTAPVVNKLFYDFWNIGDFDQQNYYIRKLVKKVSVKRHRPSKTPDCPGTQRSFQLSYSVMHEGKTYPVCRAGFLAMHGLKRGRVEATIRKASMALVGQLDQRGKHKTQKKKIIKRKNTRTDDDYTVNDAATTAGDEKNETQPEKWVRSLAKVRRNKGEEYVSRGKKRMPARVIGPPCNDGCFSIVTRPMVEQLFKHFWDIGDFDKQNTYIQNLVKKVDIKRHRKTKTPDRPGRERTFQLAYSVEHKGFSYPVCRGAFLSIFGLKRGRVEMAIKKASLSPLAQMDLRGRHKLVKKIVGEL